MLAECERDASFILPCALRPCALVLFYLAPCALAFLFLYLGGRAWGPGSSAAGKRKGPRRALALCVVLEAISQLSDTFGLSGVERLEQLFCCVAIFARINDFFQRGDNGLNFSDAKINADLDFQWVCV